MSDTDSDSLTHPRRLDSESERHGRSAIKSTSCMAVNVSPNSVDFVQIDLSTKLGISLSTRLAHQLGNRVGSVPLKEAGSCKGDELLGSPTLTHPQKDTPPILLCHLAGP